MKLLHVCDERHSSRVPPLTIHCKLCRNAEGPEGEMMPTPSTGFRKAVPTATRGVQRAPLQATPPPHTTHKIMHTRWVRRLVCRRPKSSLPQCMDPPTFIASVHGARHWTGIYIRGCRWVPTPPRLKLLHACDQWHSSRVFTPLTGWHCKTRPNTKGVEQLDRSVGFECRVVDWIG